MTSLVTEAYQSAYSACQTGCQNVYTSIVKPTDNTVRTIATAVVDTGLWIGEEFKKITEEHLPKPVAIIVQKLFSSIPVATLYFFLPLPLPTRLAIWAGYEIFRLRNQVADEALGLAMAAESIRALSWFIGGREVIDIAACAVTALASPYYLHRSTT